MLCGTIKDFIVCISEISNVIGNTEFNDMRQDLKYKLDKFLKLLQKEEFKITYQTKIVRYLVYFFSTIVFKFNFSFLFRKQYIIMI